MDDRRCKYYYHYYPTYAGPFELEEDGGERGENLQGNSPYMPSFLSTPANVTFLTGEEAVLQCAIENRGTRTVSQCVRVCVCVCVCVCV